MPFSIIPESNKEIHWGDIKGSLNNQEDLKNAISTSVSQSLNQKYAVTAHSWMINGEITIENCSTCTYVVFVPNSVSAVLKAVNCIIKEGRSVSFKIQRNSNDLIFQSDNMIIHNAEASLGAYEFETGIYVNNSDRFDMIITAFDGNPKNLTVELHFILTN